MFVWYAPELLNLETVLFRFATQRLLFESIARPDGFDRLVVIDVEDCSIGGVVVEANDALDSKRHIEIALNFIFKSRNYYYLSLGYIKFE